MTSAAKLKNPGCGNVAKSVNVALVPGAFNCAFLTSQNALQTDRSHDSTFTDLKFLGKLLHASRRERISVKVQRDLLGP